MANGVIIPQKGLNIQPATHTGTTSADGLLLLPDMQYKTIFGIKATNAVSVLITIYTDANHNVYAKVMDAFNNALANLSVSLEWYYL